MKILTFLKQVPQIDQVRFDRANRIVREGVGTICNPLDMHALGHALTTRSDGDEVVVVTMGPPDARGLLEDAIARGADRGVHLTDRLFKGADTLATARALAAVIEREAPDLALFGRATLDGATAQLGQQVATLAGLPHVSEAVAVRRDGTAVVIEREAERRHETWEAPSPVVVTVLRGPEPPAARVGREGPIEELTAADLGGRPADYGTRGSPTFVLAVRTPERGEPTFVTSADDAARHLRHTLRDARRKPAAWEPQVSPVRDIWVLAPHAEDGYERSAFEGLACARSIAAPLDASVTAVVLAEDTPPVDVLAARGADRVLVLRHPDLATATTAAAEESLVAGLQSAPDAPVALIAPWTTPALDVIPRVAARLGLGLTGDAIGVRVDEESEPPRVQWIKPAWAGTVEALVVSRTAPSIATIRPGSYTPLAPREGASPEIEVLDVEIPAGSPDVPRLLSATDIADDGATETRDVVLCVGADASPEDVAAVSQVAERARATVGGSPDAVRAGLVPPQAELDIVHRSVSPALCVAVGARTTQELAAVRGAGTLITIHEDDQAPAHTLASVAVVASPGAILTRLLG